MYRYTTITGANLFGSNYNNDFVLYASGPIQSDIFSFMDGKDMETGVQKSIVRPLQYIRETYNYKETILLLNQNLNELGTLIAQYTSGTNTILEYVLPYWVNYSGNPGPFYSTRFIRVIRDADNKELERFIVIKGDVSTADRAIQSNDIFVSAGDRFEYTFDFKSDISIPGGYYVYTQVIISDGITTYYLNKDGVWQNTPPGIFLRPQYYIEIGDDLNQWHTWTISCFNIPIEAKLNVFLFVPIGAWGTREMYFRNINFNIITFLSGFGNIIGHTHLSSQSKEIKNNINKEIFIDQSPRRTIKGSLFLDTYTGFLINRTNGWKYPGIVLDPVNNLGTATTLESFFTRFKPRAKYEGNYLKVLQGNGPYEFVTPLSMFKQYGNEEIYRFVPGKMAIDYKNANVDLTLYELIDNMGYNFNGGLTAVYLEWAATKLYEFNYLFEN
jgi:hypothetical protein